jgi:hypothetical protein
MSKFLSSKTANELYNLISLEYIVMFLSVTARLCLVEWKDKTHAGWNGKDLGGSGRGLIGALLRYSPGDGIAEFRRNANYELTMKGAVFRDVTLCGFCKNPRFRERISIIRVTRVGELGTTLAVTSNGSTLVTANAVPSSWILITLMMQTIHSSETSVLTRVAQSNIPEDGTLHSHCRENLKSYNELTRCRNYIGTGPI